MPTQVLSPWLLSSILGLALAWPTTAVAHATSVEPAAADPTTVEVVADETITAPSSPEPTADRMMGPGAKLTVERCPHPAPSLPAKTEVALNATLLVETSEGVGSAAMVSPDGFALTAAHVVGTDAEVRVFDHGGSWHRAAVVRVDEYQDAALLKVDWPGRAPCLQVATGNSALGSDVFILGSPAGEELSFSVSKGIVSGYRRFDGTRWVQLDAALNPGNSGGPALSPAGELVGIASWKVSHVAMEGLSFAIPIDAALDVLDVEIGDLSTPQWASMRRLAPRPVPPEDRSREPRTPVSRGPDGRVLLPIGVGALGLGLTAGIATLSVQRSSWSDGLDPGRMAGMHALSWSLVAGGAAMVTAGAVLKTKARRKRMAELGLAPSPGGAAVRGRF